MGYQHTIRLPEQSHAQPFDAIVFGFAPILNGRSHCPTSTPEAVQDFLQYFLLFVKLWQNNLKIDAPKYRKLPSLFVSPSTVFQRVTNVHVRLLVWDHELLADRLVDAHIFPYQERYLIDVRALQWVFSVLPYFTFVVA